MNSIVMDDDLLAQVHADQRKYGEAIRPPATAAQLAALRARARALLGVELPDGYVAFLQRSDGLDFDGLVIYDSSSTPEQRSNGFWQGLVAANQAWRDNPANRELLVLADTEMDLYALHLPSRSWRRIDKVGSDRFETYPSCGALLEAALRSRL
jgi:hypothetical protein